MRPAWQRRLFGNDASTPEGTGIRDYIQAMDLADGPISALRQVHGRPGLRDFKLGTGRGPLEMLEAFGKACGHALPYDEIAPHRPGDVATCWADPARAEAALDWRSRLGLDAMCADTWRWQSTHPNGHEA